MAFKPDPEGTAWTKEWDTRFARRWWRTPDGGYLAKEREVLVAGTKRPLDHSRAAILDLELQINGKRLSPLQRGEGES